MRTGRISSQPICTISRACSGKANTVSSSTPLRHCSLRWAFLFPGLQWHRARQSKLTRRSARRFAGNVALHITSAATAFTVIASRQCLSTIRRLEHHRLSIPRLTQLHGAGSFPQFFRHSMDFDCGIYCITSPSGKRYIGQATSIKTRWREHRRSLRAGIHKNRHLQNAWNKYGESGLTFSKIAIVPREDLTSREQEQINSFPRHMLYNIALDVDAPRRGHKHSAATRAMISAANMGRHAGSRHPLYGTKRRADTVAKISAGLTGKIPSAGHRAKIAKANTGRKKSPEEIKKISDSRIGKYKGAESPVARAIVCVETGQSFAAISLAVEWLKENGKPSADRSCIAKVCKMDGRQKSAYGYTWRYTTTGAGSFAGI